MEKRRAKAKTKTKSTPSPPDIAESIRQDILSGAYEPGRHLGTIELGERFGVSRGLVREALRLLESQNLVRVVPQRGAFVIALDDEELLESLKIRGALFALMCEQAAQSVDARSAAQLKQLVKRMHEFSTDPECSPRKFQNAGYDLAEALCATAGIPRLTNMLRELTIGAAIAYGYLPMATQEMRATEAAQSAALVKAVCAGQAQDAFALGRKLHDDGVARGVALAALMPRPQAPVELKGRRIRRR